MAGEKSLERSDGASIERCSQETPAGVKIQTGDGGLVSHETPAGKLQTGGGGATAVVKYPSAPRKSTTQTSSSGNSRRTVSAPRGEVCRSDASHDSDHDSLEGRGGDCTGEMGGAGNFVENQAEGAAARNNVARKLTYPSAQRGTGGEVKGKDVVVTRLSKTKRASLVLPVARVLAGLKKGRYAPRVRVDAAVYMTATLEYLVAEVLELAGNCSKYMKKKRITPRHIQMTFLHDSELGELTKGVIVPEGGVKPNNIQKELLPPHLQKKMSDAAEDSEETSRAASNSSH